jgi:hypothetical protein
MSSTVLLKKDLVPNEVPDLEEILSQSSRKRSTGLSVGTTLFMKEYGVTL